MGHLWETLLQHGYLLALFAVFVEQLGAPIPAAPVLLALGALSQAEGYELWRLLLLAITASVGADTVWYWLGRTRGNRVLDWLCRISLEPDTCVRQTRRVFDRWGASTLIFAKFVPGLSTVSPPLAGMTGMRLWAFVVWSAGGAAIWAGSSLVAGWLFRKQAEALYHWVEQAAPLVTLVLAGGLAIWVFWKYRQRKRFIQLLRVSRISPHEVLRRINEAEDPIIFDLRAESEVEHQGKRLPNARLLRPGDLDKWQHDLPRDRDVIFYCS